MLPRPCLRQTGLRSRTWSRFFQFTQGEGHDTRRVQYRPITGRLCGFAPIAIEGARSCWMSTTPSPTSSPENHYGRLPLSRGGNRPKPLFRTREVMRLWDYEEERSKDLEEERKGLDERNRSLEREKGQFCSVSTGDRFPQSRLIRSKVPSGTSMPGLRHSRRRRRHSMPRLRASTRYSSPFACKYEMNPAPVKTIEAWWPN